MEACGLRKLAFIIPALLIGLIAGALLITGLRVQNWFEGPDPESIASASLQSMREQARLVPFTARYVAVVTSRQRRFGLSAERTLIMPGTVRYEIDLARLREQDLNWDPETRTLGVTLPPIEIAGPELNFNEIKEYGGGGVLSALTNAEDRLDEANRNAGQQELLRQAKAPLPMNLAQDAARRAVERSFALPLRAAGIDATVEARFADDAARDPSRLDRSRRMEDVLKERQADR
jgi:hypothetical protein